MWLRATTGCGYYRGLQNGYSDPVRASPTTSGLKCVCISLYRMSMIPNSFYTRVHKSISFECPWSRPVSPCGYPSCWWGDDDDGGVVLFDRISEYRECVGATVGDENRIKLFCRQIVISGRSGKKYWLITQLSEWLLYCAHNSVVVANRSTRLRMTADSLKSFITLPTTTIYKKSGNNSQKAKLFCFSLFLAIFCVTVSCYQVNSEWGGGFFFPMITAPHRGWEALRSPFSLKLNR